jgi:hypothetical protein
LRGRKRGLLSVYVLYIGWECGGVVDKREVVRDAREMMVGLSSAWGIHSRCTLMLCRRLGAVVQMDISADTSTPNSRAQAMAACK